MQNVAPLGLIAGNGNFPVEFAKNASAQGKEVIAVAHRGETLPELEEHTSECTWVRVGQLGKIIRTLKRAGVKEAAFVGGITRVSLFRGFRPDLKAIFLMSKLASFKDDAVLRAVAKELEKGGVEILSANAYLKESVAQSGLLTKQALSAEQEGDARVGWEAAKGIGFYDIGQTVVVNQGVVVAVEAVEGTDKAILRAGELSGEGSVIVKVAKPEQDLRFDIPSIGIETIKTMKQAGAKVLVLEDQKAMIHEPVEVIKEADSTGISILVLRDLDELD